MRRVFQHDGEGRTVRDAFDDAPRFVERRLGFEPAQHRLQLADLLVGQILAGLERPGDAPA